MPISTPMATPRSASGAARAATIAADRASWMPPAKTIESSSPRPPESRCSRSTSTIVSQSTKLVRGPDVPAALPPLEDEPSRPVAQERRGAGPATGRAGRSGCPRLPVPSPGRAGPRRSGRTGGDRCGWPRAAPCGSRPARSRGCRRPRASRRGGRVVSRSKVSVSAWRSRARARNGRAPPRATASANAGVSLTRVIGPWRIG